VSGAAGSLVAAPGALDARQSGTTLRFLAPLAVLAEGSTTIDGSESLRRRPIGPLADALASLGATVRTREGFPPITISAGRMRGGAVTVDARRSSQFASALLLAAPYADSDVELRVTGLQAGGYVDLTIGLMRLFGATVEPVEPVEPVGGWQEPGLETVPGSRLYAVSSRHRYVAREVLVEYDASAAAHLFALAMATGGRVRVANAVPTLQPDAGILSAFVSMGATVTERGEGEGVEVSGPDQLDPIDVDLSTMPDQLPTLAALAALARGTSRFAGLSVVRAHESDRLLAVARELGRLGVVTRAGDDWLEVRGSPEAVEGASVDTYNDHRMAMAFTALGARVGGVVIRDASVVDKTYPRFFVDAARLGLGLVPRA
jgi:3-phosphoshikimate 1-carboxyvinyltransferase